MNNAEEGSNDVKTAFLLAGNQFNVLAEQLLKSIDDLVNAGHDDYTCALCKLSQDVKIKDGHFFGSIN